MCTLKATPINDICMTKTKVPKATYSIHTNVLQTYIHMYMHK